MRCYIIKYDRLPADHQCFVYEDIFEQLDTSGIEEQYSVLGQNTYHPRLITGILIYAYCFVCPAGHNLKLIVIAITKGAVCPAALRKGYNMA